MRVVDGRKEEEERGGEGHKIIMKPEPRTTDDVDRGCGGEGDEEEERTTLGGDPIPTREYEIERERGGVVWAVVGGAGAKTIYDALQELLAIVRKGRRGPHFPPYPLTWIRSTYLPPVVLILRWLD